MSNQIFRDNVHALTEEARGLLARLAEINAEIDTLTRATKKKSGERRPAASNEVTPAVILGVLETYEREPLLTQHQIAARYGINQGRVSTILDHYR